MGTTKVVTHNKATTMAKRGPKPGSLNAIKNGTRLTVLGELPPGMRRQQSNVRKYRRSLEELVMQAKGQISATDSHLIDEAATAEVHGAICRWLMKTRIAKMTVSDVARCSEQVVKAKTARNRAVAALHLDAPPPSPWAIDAPSDESTDVPEPTDGENQ